ncbi:replication initiator [Streptomyces gamaensis]|uniref:Replication initiator n=1 Tax=Streptomyces gamaensis TaxID=1763542 RepID=A0ABW0Z1G2_9ACTN
MRQLPDTDRDIIHLANAPTFHRLLEQITATGGCAHPVHLTGHTTTRDTVTGEILHHYDTRTEPGERLLIRCRNRRATVCPPCSRLHSGDTFHLVRAGLTGGKTVPATVQTHPRLFLTLTAPGFGPVHRTTTSGQPCRPRRGTGHCEHGKALGCGSVHPLDDPLAGQPLCPGCYDYTTHVLWHAHAGQLWDRFTRAVRRHLATTAGITQSRFPDYARLSFAKVAEYQRRAAVHVHAVVRLDGPDGPTTPPPAWGTVDTLTTAIRAAARTVTVHTAYSPATGQHTLRWGTQLDVRPLRTTTADADGLADDAVAAYVAKYISKGAHDTGAGTDHRLTTRDDLDTAPVTPHVRALMRACWDLGALPEYEPLRLRAWAHTLGYRGHLLTKSHAYSTTYTALRADRQNHARDADDTPAAPDTVTESQWRYTGTGHTPGTALLANGVAQDLAHNHELAREALALGSRRGEAG